jgi:nucleotide-binding universal stress UspA family protein
MFRRIVVGTDGSSTADRAVDVAGSLARLTGAQVQLVTAYRPARALAPAGAGATGGAPDTVHLGYEERMVAEGVIVRARKRLEDMDVYVRSVARLGEPADALLAVAEELDAELLVIGSCGTGAARPRLLGNVAERVAQHASCSVYVVHAA